MYVTTSSVSGMMHSGIAHTQMTGFMASLEIEGLHHTTTKKEKKKSNPTYNLWLKNPAEKH
jgi:hypothetical protein